ncbi:hypothetical protein [Sphingobacterium paucimobilis]|uniref:Type II CBASS E2 protein domain-containing protein n=1 Tax=Sphingobacterium paucimobilis HER1398 TaxID=1346330 RepID=U2IXB4_9SPHI|nr:hypothetical protein [Sphingobacterium paucimobilis]ERJ57349.1 hypothetical protein M472_01080 [Sphingobacterium paucimobilis HER1398]
MGNRQIKAKVPTLKEQYIALKRSFPDAVLVSDMETYFTWEQTLKSSPLGQEYKVKMEYSRGSHPKIYVVEPKPLKLAEGEDRLPHVYDHEEQQLCLFVHNEWSKRRMIAYTIVPWIVDWLFHYELWLIDGNWKGGGTVH